MAAVWVSDCAERRIVVEADSCVSGAAPGGFVRAGDRTRTGDVQLGKLAFYH
jgi:hypothetical protein